MNGAFKLHIGERRSRLMLLDDGREIASREWEESRDMGRRLFEAIDEILTEAELAPADIASFDVETDVSDNFTSVKIAQIVATTYEFGVKRS
jgi:tRNA A37 threonylcarbamoyladenosine modification protein TsaB